MTSAKRKKTKKPYRGGKPATFNWEQVRTLYVHGYIDDEGVNRRVSFRELGRRFKVSASTVSRRCQAEGWEKERAETAKRKIKQATHQIEDRHIEEMKSIISEAEAVGRSASAVHQIAARRFAQASEPEIRAMVEGRKYDGEVIPISLKEQFQAGRLAVDMKEKAYSLKFPEQAQAVTQAAAVVNINVADMDEMDQRAVIRSAAYSQLEKIRQSQATYMPPADTEEEAEE